MSFKSIYFIFVVFFRVQPLILDGSALSTVNRFDELASGTFGYQRVLSFLCELSGIFDCLLLAQVVTANKFCLDLLSECTWCADLLLGGGKSLTWAWLDKLVR